MKVPDWARQILGKQSDEQLARWASNADALREIENTRGYKLITGRLAEELKWAERELQAASIFHFVKIQAYIDSLKVVLDFIRATTKNEQPAKDLLSERAKDKKPKTIDEYHEQIFGRKE